MKPLILIMIPYLGLYKILIKNLFKHLKNLKKSMRSLILIIIPYIFDYIKSNPKLDPDGEEFGKI